MKDLGKINKDLNKIIEEKEYWKCKANLFKEDLD